MVFPMEFENLVKLAFQCKRSEVPGATTDWWTNFEASYAARDQDIESAAKYGVQLGRIQTTMWWVINRIQSMIDESNTERHSRLIEIYGEIYELEHPDDFSLYIKELSEICTKELKLEYVV